LSVTREPTLKRQLLSYAKTIDSIFLGILLKSRFERMYANGIITFPRTNNGFQCPKLHRELAKYGKPVSDLCSQVLLI